MYRIIFGSGNVACVRSEPLARRIADRWGGVYYYTHIDKQPNVIK